MAEPLEYIATDKIFPPYLLMRLVNRRDLAYLELRDSIQEIGLLSPICVRVSPRREGWYEIVSGMRRWSCHVDLKIPVIPAIIKEADDTKVLRMQLIENAVRADAQPIEYANQMKRLFMASPKMNFSHLSSAIKKSPAWIKKMLGLLTLYPAAAKKVDRGEIPISSAYMLSKLPKWLQTDLIEEAIFMPVKDFCMLCREHLFNFRQIRKEDRQANYWKTAFEPHPYLQFYRVIVAEWKHLAVGPTLLIKNNITKPIDAWKLALSWILHMDKDNIAEQEKRAKEKCETMQRGIQMRANDRNAKFDQQMIEKMPEDD